MSEETTERLDSGDSFEARVLRELAAIKGGLSAVASRLTKLEDKVGELDSRITALERRVEALEEKVDMRLRETRPIWETVLELLRVMDGKFDVHAHDMLQMRGEINVIKKHLPPAA